MSKWPTKVLREIFRIENGFAFKSSDFIDSGIPVIKIKNIKAGYFSAHEFSYVDEKFLGARPDKIAQKGDLLISMSGNRHDGSPETWVGKVAFFYSSRPHLINQRVGALRPIPNAGIDLRYFAYVLAGMEYQNLFISIATSSGGQANLSPAQILSAEIAVPPLDEQKRISSILSALDDKIELNWRMNETLEALARALFRDWFIDFGPVKAKMAGAAPYLSPDLWSLFPDRLDDDGLPEGWTRTSIYEIANVVYGAPFASDKFNTEGRGRPLVRIRDLPKHEAGQFTEEIHRKEFVIEPGDLVVGMDGEFRAYIWRGIPSLMNQRVCAFRPNEERNRAFIWLTIEPQLLEYENSAIGTTVIHLGKKDIDRFRALDAGDDIRDAFSKLTEPLLDRLVANGSENRTLAQTRDLLLPNLMSGEIRLGDVERELELA